MSVPLPALQNRRGPGGHRMTFREIKSPPTRQLSLGTRSFSSESLVSRPVEQVDSAPIKETHILEDKKPTFQSVLQESQKIWKLVKVNRLFDQSVSPKIRRNKIKKAIQKSLGKLQVCSAKLNKMQIVLNKKRTRILERTHENLIQKCRFHQKSKVIRNIIEEYRLEINNLKQQHIQRIYQNINDLNRLASLVQRDEPDTTFSINIDALKIDMDSFPNSNEDAIELIRKKEILKRYYSRTMPFTFSYNRISLDELIKTCYKTYQPDLLVFDDDGTSSISFQIFLENNTKEFLIDIEKRIQASVLQPQNCGTYIIQQCEAFIELFKLNKNHVLPILFILFSRHFFSKIYVNEISEPLSAVVYNAAYLERLIILKKLMPTAYGSAPKYMPESMRAMPLKMIPDNNPYKEAMVLLQTLSFHICPIDFCRQVHCALRVIHQIAFDIAFNEGKGPNGQLIGKDDFELTFDELFDITTVIFLLSDPICAFFMVKLYAPYIHGLKMPSEFNFAFTNLKAICEMISKMDVNDFVEQAKNTTLPKIIELETDPLNIMK